MKKVTVATLIPLAVLGLVVPGNIIFVIRNLILKVNLAITLPLVQLKTTNPVNTKINSNLNTNNKSTYFYNSSLKNLEEYSISTANSSI